MVRPDHACDIFLIQSHGCIIKLENTPRWGGKLESGSTMTRDSKGFAVRLKEAAGEAGIYSPRELARLLDVQVQTVNQWYGGNARPNGKNLTNLLGLLHIDSDWLMHGTSLTRVIELPAGHKDPARDFREALAVVSGMGGLLSERDSSLASEDANKIGRTVNNAAKHLDLAFQALLGMYIEKCNHSADQAN